jgi:hypothetical protein
VEVTTLGVREGGKGEEDISNSGEGKREKRGLMRGNSAVRKEWTTTQMK